MRIKASKLLAAVLALCLTLGTAPAASAAALPQSAPGSQDITPYFLYIKGQDCILDISGRTAYINAWVSGQTSVATKCKVRAELQEKSGTYAWTTVDFWTDQQNGTWAEVDETAAVTSGRPTGSRPPSPSGPGASRRARPSIPTRWRCKAHNQTQMNKCQEVLYEKAIRKYPRRNNHLM